MPPIISAHPSEMQCLPFLRLVPIQVVSAQCYISLTASVVPWYKYTEYTINQTIKILVDAIHVIEAKIWVKYHTFRPYKISEEVGEMARCSIHGRYRWVFKIFDTFCFVWKPELVKCDWCQKLRQNFALLIPSVKLRGGMSGWLRRTVGRTPVFGRRTDPVLRSACSRRVTTMWVNRPLQVSQLGQLSLSSLRGR